jgi:hypothetical protein
VRHDGDTIARKDSDMTSIGAVPGTATLTPLQRAKLVEDSPAEEKTESVAQEAKEQAADQAKKLSASHSTHTVDHFA